MDYIPKAAMISGKVFAFFFLIGSCFATSSVAGAFDDYPTCRDNPFVDERMRVKISPFLLPFDHPIRDALDSIFLQSRVIQDEGTLIDAGFEIISRPKEHCRMIVARHPLMIGYVFKLYLDSENWCRKGVPHWKRLFRRCVGAAAIRNIIERKHIRYFVVPDKWIYVLPVQPFSCFTPPQPIILVETDMHLVSKGETRHRWKTDVSRKHLDELYLILKEGHGGPGIVKLNSHVPFTKYGKFAFINTEDCECRLKLKHVKEYLCKEMQYYWDFLTE